MEKNAYMQKYASSRGNFVKSFLALTYLCLMLFTGSNAWGQVSFYSFAQSSETYTPITGGTVLVTATDATYPNSGDDVIWNIANGGIPFNFNYNGTNYTGLNVSSNGFITFGSTAPGATNYTPISSGSGYSGAIAGWGGDMNGAFLTAVMAGEVRWEVVGSAPNREFVVQYKNWRPAPNNNQTDVTYMNLQIRLVEGTNAIKVVYGATGIAAGTAVVATTRQIGLRGSSNTDYNNRKNATSVAFTASTAGTANSSTQAFSYAVGATEGLPTNGLTYTWTPPVACSGAPEAGVIATLTQNVCSGSAPAQIVSTGFSTGVTGVVYQWEESNDNGAADAWANAVGGSGATTTSYTPPSFSGTTIYYRLKATCTAASQSDYTSAVMVTTQVAPATPSSNIVFSNITIGKMTIDWTAGSGNRRYVVVNTTNTFTDPVNGQTGPATAAAAYAGGEQVVYNGTGTSVSITGLSCNTVYYVRVYEYQRCGSSAPFDFYYNTTAVVASQASGPVLAPLPVVNNFTGFSGSDLPATVPGWYESAVATTAGSTPGLTNPAGITSGWISSSAVGTTAKINLYTNTLNEWIISPRMLLTDETTLSFKAAITDYNSSSADAAGMQGTDDNVYVMISTDGCGATWTPVYTFNAANTTTLTNALMPYTVQLGHVGETAQIAFVAVDGPVNDSPDYDFHIGNIQVFLTPDCVTPINLTATTTSTTTGTISWDASTSLPTGGYEYEVRTSGAAGSGATGLATSGTTAAGILTKSLTGLTPSTSYNVYVRANCGSGSFSDWSTVATLYTNYCIPAPSSVDGDGIINVVSGTISNATPDDPEAGNYGDFSAQSTSADVNSTVSVAITYGTGYTYDTKIWVDWNNDLDFSDAGENVYTGTSLGANPTTLTATFTVPVGVSTGAHRMRIGGQDAGPVLECYSGTYGTFEDYTLNVTCPATIPAPTAAVGATVCTNGTADLSITGIAGATLSWYDAATAGTLVNSDATYTTAALPATASYWVEQSYSGCPTPSSRVEVVATVTAVNAQLAGVDATCNGGSNGSFTLGTIDCGLEPFTYSVDGGAYGPIPTDLEAGTYSVIIKDANLALSQAQSIVVGEPSTVIAAPVAGADEALCVGGTSADVTASVPALITATATMASGVIDISVPDNTPAGITNTLVIAGVPAGATITEVAVKVKVSHIWDEDIDIFLTGPNGTQIELSTDNGGEDDNYTNTIFSNLGATAITAGTAPFTGTYLPEGDLTTLFSQPNGNWVIKVADDASIISGKLNSWEVTVHYTLPNLETITWWTAANGGTQLGTGATLAAVGTSVLPDGNTIGTYTFYAQTESAGCSSLTRSAVDVNVVANPVPVITSASLAFCAGDDLELTSSSAASYSWSTTETTGVITVDEAGSYTVTVTDANGCVGTSAAAVVTVNALPTVGAGTDQTVCENTMVTLTGSGAASYAWDNSVTDATAFAATATTTYTVTGTDANGCTDTDDVTVSVNELPEPTITSSGSLVICESGDLELTSSAATGNVWSTTETTGAITVDEAGSYTVTVTDDNGCVGTSAPSVVTVNALPTVNAGADIAVCQNGQAILFATGAQTYVWDNNITNGVSFVATATTTYSVTGTDANGCSNTDEVVVTINPLPTVEAGVNQTLCGAGDVTLTATGATVYSWNNNVVNGVAFTAPVGSNAYTVTGVDALGCANTDIVIVTVNAVPVAAATAANQLTIVATPAGQSYQWVNCAGNTPILGATNSTFTATENGSYKVIVTGMGGCADTSACVNISSVGLVDLDADLGIALYPNPTGGNVYVSMTGSEPANVTVYDAQGKVVSAMSNIQDGAVIDLNGVQKGMYMIQVANTAGSNIFRIVKN